MKYTLITRDNIDGFRSVLPQSSFALKSRYSIGAYTDDGLAVGAASFVLIGNQYSLDWLYVTPDMRGQKIATGLLDEIFAFINGTGEAYPIRAEYEVSPKDRSLYGFFLSRDEFDTAFSHHRYYVYPEDLTSSAGLKKSGEINLSEKEFFSLAREYQNQYLNELSSHGDYLIDERKSWTEVCIHKLTRVVCQGDKLLAAVFILGRNDGNLELSYLYSNNPLATKKLISNVAAVIAKDYPQAQLIFDAVGEKSVPLANKLFPNAMTVPVYESFW